MRYLELRRHTRRTGLDPHISQPGLILARRVGAGMGPFARVISSPAPRCVETAVAMGFAVSGQYQPVQETMKASDVRKVAKRLPMDASFVQRAETMRDRKAARRYAAALLKQWTELTRQTPPGKTTLVLTHGGYLEDSAVACLPHAAHASWGANFSHCEGVRLAFDKGRFVSAKLMRVPARAPALARVRARG